MHKENDVSKGGYETNPLPNSGHQISPPQLSARLSKTGVENIVSALLWVILFAALYIFFRYVQPITPWDGDDWETVMAVMARKGGPYPEAGSGYFFPQMIGTLSGFLAGFVIYPLTGNYILSYATIGAIFMAGTISLLLGVLYLLFRHLTGQQRYAIFGVLFFLLSSFLIFRTNSSSEYLFWRYNYCTLIFYELPSYLSSALGIYLLWRHIYDPVFHLDLKTGFVILGLYCLNYSFLPAAFLLSAISFSIVTSAYRNDRNLKKVCQNCWIYMLNWPLFLVELYCEFKRTFGTGYFKAPVDFSAQLKASLDFFRYTFSRINRLFLIISIVILLASIFFYLRAKFHHAIDGEDRIFARITFILLTSILLMTVFFVIFGAIDSGHTRRGEFIRTDTLCSLYFLLIGQIAICLCYLLKKLEQIQAALPVLILLMAFVIISPKYGYSSSIYDFEAARNIPSLTTKVMIEVVREIQQREEDGITSLIVHVPASYGGYNGGNCAYPLYRHHVTDHLCTIEFRYDPDISEVYFE